MGKKALKIIITLVILLCLSYAFTYFTHTKFIDYAFVVGIISTVNILLFTSRGGFASQYADSTIQSQTTNFKLKSQSFEFKPNIAFFTSLTYTILSLIAMLIHYRSYF